MPEKPKASERLLSKEVAPFGSVESGQAALGGVVHPDDPVLVHLSEFGDERAYTAMVRAEPGISSALETRFGTIISAGYSIEPGDQGGAEAEELAEWARSYLRSGLRNVDQVQRAMLEGVSYGWVPINVIWGEWRAKGRRWYVPIRAPRKKHDQYRFTYPGHHLVHYWTMGVDPEIYQHRVRGSLDWYRWITPKRGEVDSPYGDPLLMYVWMIYSVKQRFFRMWAAGMGRSMGMLQAKRAPVFGGQIGAKAEGSAKHTFSEIRAQLVEVLEFLAAHNILVSLDGYELSWLENVKYADGWKDPLAYIDQWIQVAIAGEGLTATMGMNNAAGSRAAGEVTERKTERRSRADAQYLDGSMSDLLWRAIEWNFGEVDDDVRPRFRSKIGQTPQLEALRLFIDAGGRASEGRIADQLGVSVPSEVKLDDILGENRPADAVPDQLTPFVPGAGEEGEEIEGQEAEADHAKAKPAAPPAKPSEPPKPPKPPTARQRNANLSEADREEQMAESRIKAAAKDAERYVEDLVAEIGRRYAEALQ